MVRFSVVTLFVLQLISRIIADKQARVLLHSDEDLIEAFNNMSARISILETKLAQSGSGTASTYVRWGRTVCPGNGSDLVYKGFTAGNDFSKPGGGADYLCLPQEPIWGYYVDGVQAQHARVYGAEYEFGQHFHDGGAQFFGKNLYQHDVPCALCHSSRPTTVMIPGRNQCYPGWTLEYHGYLVSGRNPDSSASNYACLDIDPESEFGDYQDLNGRMMIFVESRCSSLKCPPYVEGRELTCVVCSI